MHGNRNPLNTVRAAIAALQKVTCAVWGDPLVMVVVTLHCGVCCNHCLKLSQAQHPQELALKQVPWRACVMCDAWCMAVPRVTCSAGEEAQGRDCSARSVDR